MSDMNTTRPNDETKPQALASGQQTAIAGLGGIMFLGILFFAFITMFFPLRDLEHYIRVYQNPMTVTATVIQHETHRDDGDTKYKSIISYTVQRKPTPSTMKPGAPSSNWTLSAPR